MSDRQAHGQTHRQETAGRCKLISQSHSTCERPGPEERMGAGCQERQRQKETKVQRQTPRQREGDTDRQTYACTRAHTHTHREAETERGRRRASDRETANGRQTGERGWHRIRDRHTGTAREAPQREATHKKQIPQGRGHQPWARPRLDAVPWGWQSPVGTPRLPRSRGLKGPLQPGYLRGDPAPIPRPEGECVSMCVSVSVWGWVDLGPGGYPEWRGEGVEARGWEACVSSCCLSLPLSPSPLPVVSSS